MRRTVHPSQDAITSLLNTFQTHCSEVRPRPFPEGSRQAAQYIRMSTDQQVYSPQNQKAAIQEYAAAHGFEIVRTYEDDAKSGLVFKHRAALRRLLQDVLSGEAEFEAVLVYDVSRWGRFQDADEAACYEFLCRASGVSVRYCAELFSGEITSLRSSVMKSVKRAMASEFSRQLSVRVFSAKSRAVQRGFWVGGQAPFGLRRALVSPDRDGYHILELGQWKSRSCDHEILVPGPASEVEVVRKIFSMASRGINPVDIARKLNQRGITNRGKSWQRATVGKMLEYRAYVGTNVWNRLSQRLRSSIVKLPSGDWIQQPKSFVPIVRERIFDSVQKVLESRRRDRFWSKDQVIAKLKSLFGRKGQLTEKLIVTTPGMPDTRAIRRYFGSLSAAYKAIGYVPNASVRSRTASLRQSLQLRSQLTSRILSAFPEGTAELVANAKRPLIRINQRLILSVFVCCSSRSVSGHIRWSITPRVELIPEDFSVIGFLDSANSDFHIVHLFPRSQIRRFHLFSEFDPWFAKGLRISGLSRIYEATQSLSARRHGVANGG